MFPFDRRIVTARSHGLIFWLAAGVENRLYVAPSPAVTAGTTLKVYVLRPNKTLVAGGTLTN